MNRNWFVLPAMICLVGASLNAGTVEKKVLEANLTRQIASATSKQYKNPYQRYQEQIAQVKNPSFQTLRPLFKELAAYNLIFNENTNLEKSFQLANMLAQETKVGWNEFKPVGMLEIFDTLFPQVNTDNDISQLEYNIKLSLLSKEQWKLINQFDNININDAFVEECRWIYHNIECSGSPLSIKENIQHFVHLIKFYNAKEKKTQEMLKQSAFITPLHAGWGRTVTLKEVFFKIGTDTWSDGEEVIILPEELQSRYGLSAEDATILYQFIHDYDK